MESKYIICEAPPVAKLHNEPHVVVRLHKLLEFRGVQAILQTMAAKKFINKFILGQREVSNCLVELLFLLGFLFIIVVELFDAEVSPRENGLLTRLVTSELFLSLSDVCSAITPSRKFLKESVK